MLRRILTFVLVVAIGGLVTVAVTQGEAAAGFRSGQQMHVTLPSSPTVAWTQAVTWGAPFSSGQTITVQMPANAVLSPHAPVQILECAAPDGVPPTSSAACDPATANRTTVLANADGSFADDAYQVYALPDGPSRQTPPSPAVTCGATRATECVLYLGADYRDLRQPHFWSQGFAVDPYPGDVGVNPGDGTPPTPMSRLAVLANAALGAASSDPALHTTCTIGPRPDSTCTINQVISVTVAKACHDGDPAGDDTPCTPTGPGQGAGSGAGQGEGSGAGQGSSGALPFTTATEGATGGGSSGLLPFTGADLGTLAVLGAMALLAGWLLQRRRPRARRRGAG